MWSNHEFNDKFPLERNATTGQVLRRMKQRGPSPLSWAAHPESPSVPDVPGSQQRVGGVVLPLPGPPCSWNPGLSTIYRQQAGALGPQVIQERCWGVTKPCRPQSGGDGLSRGHLDGTDPLFIHGGQRREANQPRKLPVTTSL